jgi:hypothetical protein
VLGIGGLATTDCDGDEVRFVKLGELGAFCAEFPAEVAFGPATMFDGAGWV